MNFTIKATSERIQNPQWSQEILLKTYFASEKLAHDYEIRPTTKLEDYEREQAQAFLLFHPTIGPTRLTPLHRIHDKQKMS